MMNKFSIAIAAIGYVFHDLLVMRVGRVVDITVWDSFSGTVKIIKNGINKWFIEIVDVSMCYPQQVQLAPGERMWISRRDLYRDLYNN